MSDRKQNKAWFNLMMNDDFTDHQNTKTVCDKCCQLITGTFYHCVSCAYFNICDKCYDPKKIICQPSHSKVNYVKR